MLKVRNAVLITPSIVLAACKIEHHVVIDFANRCSISTVGQSRSSLSPTRQLHIVKHLLYAVAAVLCPIRLFGRCPWAFGSFFVGDNMLSRTNHRPALDPAIPFSLFFGRHRRRAGEAGR